MECSICFDEVNEPVDLLSCDHQFCGVRQAWPEWCVPTCGLPWWRSGLPATMGGRAASQEPTRDVPRVPCAGNALVQFHFCGALLTGCPGARRFSDNFGMRGDENTHFCAERDYHDCAGGRGRHGAKRGHTVRHMRCGARTRGHRSDADADIVPSELGGVSGWGKPAAEWGVTTTTGANRCTAVDTGPQH